MAPLSQRREEAQLILFYIIIYGLAPVRFECILIKGCIRTLHEFRQRKLWRLMFTTVNTHLLPAFDQHRFRPEHSTTSALLQLTSDVATGFNQRKLPYRTICAAVMSTAAFYTVNHTYCYQILKDQRFLRHPVDGCRTSSEADTQLQDAEASCRRQG